MKQINVYFEDEEFSELDKAKGDMSWREFILVLLARKDLQHSFKRKLEGMKEEATDEED
jgi:hypothetical protein